MSKFDESKPYSCVYGAGGIQSYEQNGLMYSPRKKLIEGQAVPEAATAEPLPDYTTFHWKKLKELVEENSGTWIDKASAIEFLTAK